ncbi:MAG TPA: hypothetical protein VN256_13170 [Pyrinomonadaceae bacterium]|nr:hypothetical protein [Pyrinomonadaceae bacterium]
MSQAIRLIKRDKNTPPERDCDILPPELAEAIRQFMRQEWQRLRRDELFHLRRGMKSELEGIDKELGLKSE